jgi:hypothetical protein
MRRADEPGEVPVTRLARRSSDRFADMNANELEAKLLKAARALPAKANVPYAFEKRVMAALRTQPAIDPWALWSRLLWRAAAPCVGIMLALSAWTVVNSASSQASLAADLEQNIWGPLTSLNDSW